jgi:hypothetical protein
MYNFGNLQSNSSKSPEVLLAIYNPDDKESGYVTIAAVVDTGAESSVIPESILDSLTRLTQKTFDTGNIQFETASGDCIEYMVVTIGIGLMSQSIDNVLHPKSLDVAVMPNKDYALLGRDFLSDFKVVFNFVTEAWMFCQEDSCTEF